MLLSRAASCDRDPEECRITATSKIVEPVIDWTPVYDGAGQQINLDPNVFVVVATCATCGESWIESTTAGVTTIRRNLPQPDEAPP